MSPIKQKRILLVDDNTEIHNDIRKILSTTNHLNLDDDEAILFGTPKITRNLESQNYQIDSAIQGQEALELVKKSLINDEPYMLAFVDMVMPPGWDGLETIKHLWAMDPRIQMVICSAYSEHSWENIIRALGNSDNLLILKKPFDIVEILQLTYALTKKWELKQEAHLRLQEQEELIQYFFNEVDFLYRLNKLSQEKFSQTNIFNFYIDGICRLHNWPVGHIYFVDKDNEAITLKPANIWYVEDKEQYAAFQQITNDTTFNAEQGLPGRVLQTGEPFWIEDIKIDPDFPRSKPWVEIGVRGAVAVPIKLHNEIIAIAEFFSIQPMPKNQRILDLTDAAAIQLGLLLERQLNEKKLEENYLKLERIHKEMKNTQAQLLQHAKLASIGQLAAGVAHEINNPIAFVTGNTEMLQGYCEKFRAAFDGFGKLLGSPNENVTYEDIKHYWDLLCKETKLNYFIDDSSTMIKESLEGLERVRSIVADLKSFSHVNDDEIQEVDINQCIDITLKMVGNELKYKCEVIKNYHPLPLLRCYPRQLNQVFMNLLVNACQAIHERGTISITTQVGDDAIQAIIQDTGEGIKPEHMDNLFELFFTTKPIGQGTGLGLSISYNIIKKHGGKIKVDSVVGKGTTFTIILPLAGV
ncbi:ATP-binding protein [Legionella sp. km772]|uniref:ATP-binding protein n=1 Tax=Legionella sp. km772 TaxID=2498111 RepID=UPI000F8E8067|nr:ATP-binding protein [Legionella sp. km772]RUR06009.1 response regulator [Legionella sp. km772]